MFLRNVEILPDYAASPPRRCTNHLLENLKSKMVYLLSLVPHSPETLTKTSPTLSWWMPLLQILQKRFLLAHMSDCYPCCRFVVSSLATPLLCNPSVLNIPQLSFRPWGDTSAPKGHLSFHYPCCSSVWHIRRNSYFTRESGGYRGGKYENIVFRVCNNIFIGGLSYNSVSSKPYSVEW
jgi:hypothetical protein